MAITRRAALLQVLADREWHGQDELAEAVSHRFASALHDLRTEGFNIVTEHIRDERYRYRLISRPDEEVQVVRVPVDPNGQGSLEL